MIPRSILQQLSRLRWAECRLRLVWGAALWLTLAALVFAFACLIDWIIDLRQDTPLLLRRAMLYGQLVLWSVGAIALLLVPWLRRPGDAALALWVEERLPALGHRLISTVQLNRAGARVQGMSPALIAAVTSQTEEQFKQLDLTRLANRKRLRWSAWLLGPVLLLGVVMLLLWPRTVVALVARQFLADREIPRSVYLESQAATIWPSGEEVALEFRVSRITPLWQEGGGGMEDWQGEVRIVPNDGRAPERYPLRYAHNEGAGRAVFVAKIPATSVDYSYRAWLGDGRTRRPAHVHLEPRPVVQQLDAWVRLPGACGYRLHLADTLPLTGGRLLLSGLAAEPFEQYQKGGDIVQQLTGSGARVTIVVQKPVVSATLELISRPDAGAETVVRQLPMTLDDQKQSAEVVFAPRPGEAAYRVLVLDEHAFENAHRPRRGIRSETADAPLVALLPEYFSRIDRGPSEEYEVEGIPVLVGERIRIGFRSTSPLGLSRAQLRYRVITDDELQDYGEDGIRRLERPWETLPLQEVLNSDDTGPFDPRRGVFVFSGRDSQVWFHRVPSGDMELLGGTLGGGRFDFQTSPLSVHLARPEVLAALNVAPDGSFSGLPWAGLLLAQERNEIPTRALQAGDRVEFYVEVFDRNPDPDRPPGRSEMRRKTLVTSDQLLDWLVRKDDQKQRVRDLELKQRGIYGDAGEPNRKPLPVVSPARLPATIASSATADNLVLGRSWQLLGPFPDPDDTGHARVYPPEKEPVDLRKDYDGLAGKVSWQTHHSGSDRIDLEKFFRHGEAGVAYAVCWVQCKRQPAVLATGSDDGIQVWLNRKRVLDKAVHREAVAGEDKTPIELDSGWNEVLVKVDNRFGSWAFFLELRDPNTGKPLRNVVCKLMPPGQDDRAFVRNWLIVGPFPNVTEDGHIRVFPPERDPVDPNAEFEGRKGTIVWKAERTDHINGRVDLQTLFDLPFNDSGGVAYAVCWVHTARERPAVLATGSDDGIKVWLNRKQVVARAVKREVAAGDDLTNIELAAGWNEILVKVDNGFGRWAFCLELREAGSDRPLKGVEFRTTPPKE